MIPDDDAYGNAVWVERDGKEVRLVFKAGTLRKARDLEEDLVHQLKTGVLFLSLTGETTGER